MVGFVRDNSPDAGQTEPAPAPAAPAGEELEDKVKAIVAEQTGYPVDMLEMDLDLEADLGIDTVKQAETFAEISELFDIPRSEELRLRDYPTLGDVVGFVRDNSPDAGPATPAAAPDAEAVVADGNGAAAAAGEGLAAADTVPRRVPLPALRPALELCKPTGLTLDGESRVVLMMDQGGVGQALVERLEAMGATALLLDGELDADVVQQRCAGWLEAGAVQGVFWLPALDVEPELDELSLASWREVLRQRVKLLYATMRALVGAEDREDNVFLVSGTRLGGLHGYEAGGASAPAGGAVVGFTKAYGRERTTAVVKAVDFEPQLQAAEVAEALLGEATRDPGVVEVGLRDGLRCSVTLEDRPAAEEPGMELGPETVFVITGAAGGIVSAIVADLAAASGGTFHLLDLADEPQRDDPHVALFRQDQKALRQELIQAVKAEGGKPAEVEQRLMAVERREAALSAVEAVEAAGGTALYHRVDLRREDDVAAALGQVRERHGRVDVLLHGAGVEISRPLGRKEPAEFDLVFDVKADGMFNLLAGVRGMPLGAVVVFSSVAGRFGNAGQTDYSAANDLLCKVVSSLRASHPETRGVALDWSAWSDIGMATRGSIPKLMKMAGIEMLPPEVGIPTVRRELVRGATGEEIVVGDGLGALLAERDPHGGLDPEAAAGGLDGEGRFMIGEVTSASLYGGLQAETTLDPQEQPFLYDHQVEPDLAYLPGVMGLEAFAELAHLSAPGHHVAAVEDVRFEAPLKFYRDQPRQLLLAAVVTPAGGGELRASARLESETAPAKPGLDPRRREHFSAAVRLAQSPAAEPPPAPVPALDEARVMDSDEIYQSLFHGPAYQVLERVDLAGDTALGRWARDLPPQTAPAGAGLIWAPRLVELCFQTAGVWQLAGGGAMGLPMAVESVVVHEGAPEHGEELCAVVTARQDGAFDARVVGSGGRVHLELTGYRTTEG